MKRYLVPSLQIFTAIGILLFWLLFFTVGMAPENPPEGYWQFEHAFPFPDVVLCFALAAGGILVIKDHRLGRIISIAAAGGLIFLGMVDFSFNIQNGMYAFSFADTVTNGIINTWCVTLGVAMLFYYYPSIASE